MRSLALIAALAVLVAGGPAAAVDDRAAQNLLRKDKCLTCHAVDRKKDGPSFKEVAEKYRGEAEAEAKLTKHVTEPSMVKVDGVEEEHGVLSASDPAAVRNVVQWILSR